MLSVVAAGECMIEFAPDGKGAWQMGFAGDTFNTLWTLRALLPANAQADYVTAFGDDDFSQRQMAFFGDHEIGTADSLQLAGGRPGLYAISLKGAERSFTYWRSDSAARHLADDPRRLGRSLAARDLIYFSGITLAILPADSRPVFRAAIVAARASGARIAFDPNYRPRLWESPETATAEIGSAAANADFVLPTFDDESALFGDATPQETAGRLFWAGVEECVVKNGAEPALVCKSGQFDAVPALSGVRAVDTSGAGDAFNGGYLAARLLGRDPTAAARLAHQVAASAVSVRGALTPVELLRTAFAVG